MADAFIQVAPNSTGAKMDTSRVTVGANDVDRERINISDPLVVNEHALVRNGATRVSQDTLLLYDPIEGASVNTAIWTQSQSGMTQVQGTGILTLNNAGSTTNTNYSILTSNKQFLDLSKSPISVAFRAKVTNQANSVIELGFGNAATNAAPTEGVFFRFGSDSTLKGVINFNGTETLTADMTVPTAANHHTYTVTIFDNHALFEIFDSAGVVVNTVRLDVPVTQSSPISVSHIPAFARVYNAGTPGAAAKLILGSAYVNRLDLATGRPWAACLAGTTKGTPIGPTTFAQLANWANSTVPASATLSNTAAGYTTLGGLWKFAAVAGAETDYALFAFQVPTGYQLVITECFIDVAVTGSDIATSGFLSEWGLGINSDAVSLATGGTYPPMRIPIGHIGVDGANGTPSNIGQVLGFLSRTFATPLVVESGRFLHVILRLPVAAATASQIVRGAVHLNGYFE